MCPVGTGRKLNLKRTQVLQNFLDAVATGDAIVPIHRTYRLDDIATAHADMEAGLATGKLVVLL